MMQQAVKWEMPRGLKHPLRTTGTELRMAAWLLASMLKSDINSCWTSARIFSALVYNRHAQVELFRKIIGSSVGSLTALPICICFEAMQPWALSAYITTWGAIRV